MSHSELAADRLRHCLPELIPSLLAALSDLLQSDPRQQHLLPFSRVHEALKPIADTASNREAFGLVETLSTTGKDDPEVRLRNLCLEISNNELRRLVLEDPSGLTAGSGGTIDHEQLQIRLASTLRYLDAILVLSLHDLIDPTLPPSLIEELMEAQPISTCSRLFEYTESRVKPLTVDLHPSRGKGLVLLRTCNRAAQKVVQAFARAYCLRRSYPQLAGQGHPSRRQSGVNLRGEFNVENKNIHRGEV